MANEKTDTVEMTELDESLWKAIGVFVKQCGGDVGKVTPEEREEFQEALAAWAILAVSDE